jgi:hypothetical protein
MKDICRYVPEWNAFDCETTEFAVLDWSSIGSDD